MEEQNEVLNKLLTDQYYEVHKIKKSKRKVDDIIDEVDKEIANENELGGIEW